MLEYDKGKAVALVEYKHERAETATSGHPSYRALIDLGTRAGIPVFAVRYADDFAWWRVVPLNQCAHEYLAEPRQMVEDEWVAFLYRLRGAEVPQEVLQYQVI